MLNRNEPHRRNTMHRTLVLMLLTLAVLVGGIPVGASGEEPARKTNETITTSALTNIGFMENPPQELRDRFPMCDAFLKVEWIDKEKKIGYSNYEAIIKGKKKTMWALVTLDDEAPSYGWDVYQYKQKGRLKEVFEMIKYGKDTGNLLTMVPTYKGKSVTIYNVLQTGDSLADNRITVCVAYPDNRKVWIAEGKSVAQTYDREQQQNLSNKIKESGQQFSIEWLESLWILDINFDGREDFVLETSFATAWDDNKFHVAERVFKYPDFQLIFPPSGRSCLLRTSGTFPLITDGKNYYISNQCNITELSSSSFKK